MARALIRTVLLLVLCAYPSLPAHAQTNPVNPTTVTFTPSADDSALTAGGQPMVTSYSLQIYLAGAAQPIISTSLGKPTPDPDGVIRVNFSTLLVAWPLADGTYDARVAAVGPTGSGLSDPSNDFDCQSVATSPCTYALSPATSAVAVAGGAVSVGVTTSAVTCAWAATSDSAWAVASPASGTGSGTVTVTVAPNTGAVRTATVAIGDQTYAVTQAAAPPPCTFALASSSASIPSAAGTSSVALTASAGSCAWTATSDSAWAVASPASGTGSGTVTVTVAANTGTARTATVTIGGQTYAVTQAAPRPCTFSVSPPSVSAVGSGGTASVALTASATTCSWTASASAVWIAVGTTSGTGSASISYTLSRNTSGATRTGTLTAGGLAVTLTQASVPRPSAPRGLRVNANGASQ